jgi:hypothetical protein
MNMNDIIIVGAGASGMMAAITAAGAGRRVLLLEHMDKPGKKIYATGNGRCNFTNEYMSPDCYYGDKKLLSAVSDKFDKDDTLRFFREIGIFPKEKNGYYYPNSMQAASVAEALSAEMDRLGVQLITGAKVEKIIPKKDKILVKTSEHEYSGRRVIIAAGLKAAPKLGSDGSILPVLKECGHSFRPVLPALIGFTAQGMEFKKVSGVRCEAELSLMIEDKCVKRETGELQLADYGISGIPVFQISSPAARALYEKKQVNVHINFLPFLSKDDVLKELGRRFSRDLKNEKKGAADCLRGLLHSKLIPILLRQANIKINMKPDAVNNVASIKKLTEAICDYPVNLVSVRDFENAQVCSGGIRSEEIDTDTLESKLVPGMYFAGEILDVDGICGGYNLQWAWSSGYVAGKAAADSLNIKGK